MNMKERPDFAENILSEKVEVAIRLDSELLEKISHLSNDPFQSD